MGYWKNPDICKMNLNFLIVIGDYWRIVGRDFRSLLADWVLPCLMALCGFYVFREGISANIYDSYLSNILTLLGVLIGFSIAVITILNTTESVSIQKLKDKKKKFLIKGKQVSLFNVLNINFIYSVIVEVILCISFISTPILNEYYKINLTLESLLFALGLGLITHILMLIMRNLTNFYFALVKLS
jgi:hypothetical protein